MSLASRISNFFASTATTSPSPSPPTADSLVTSSSVSTIGIQTPAKNEKSDKTTAGSTRSGRRATEMGEAEAAVEYEHKRPPYLHCMMAGGIGGSTGDMLMHSLDTVKTRQQGAPNVPKYATMGDAYAAILREEGFRRGLYGGVAPAFMGSFPGTMIFFGTYEYSKRYMLDNWKWSPDWLTYLNAGFIGDFFASVVYVPSEVLKTRLQLQGRYNNPYFKSGYNYRGTIDALRTIIRVEGPSALFYGYKATLMRDLPFSALQFAFYEEFYKLARIYSGSKDIGLPLEIATGATAGGLAGTLTCPLDVVKTRIQTQLRSPSSPSNPPLKAASIPSPSSTCTKRLFSTSISPLSPSASPTTPATPSSSTTHHNTPSAQLSSTMSPLGLKPTFQKPISTSSPSTSSPPKSDAMKLNTSSILKGLALIYKSEGIVGLFRGVGPRMVWTSVQSGTMLVLYQALLRQIERWDPYKDRKDTDLAQKKAGL